jgi:hypothetical protein
MRKILSYAVVFLAGILGAVGFYERKPATAAPSVPTDGRAMTIDYPSPTDERRPDGSVYRRTVRLDLYRVESGTGRTVYAQIPGDDKEWVVMHGGVTYFLYPAPR